MSLKKQILVVEDNQINREMLRMILSSQYDVTEADSGQTALNLLRDRKDDIALILLDVMMPVMDGYTFLELVKHDPELALIPVIVTTQNDSETDEIAALEHGATDFVPKPYRPQIILHRVASLINLRENAAMVNQLRYDRLTGLYSKEFFYKQAQEQMRTHPERQYTIICSNIENFKLYNDVFGIAAGDRLLREIANMFLELKGRDEICGRFNADRFMLLRSQEHRTANYDHLVETGQQMLRAAKNTVMKWGVYEVASEGISVEQMCDRAFLAADSIRGQYNTHFSVYDDSLRSKLLREQVITESMEAALAQRQFQVYLQPKFSLLDDRLAGAEALVRWNHPVLGVVSPAVFIPVLESNGYITKLDQYIWGEVCKTIRVWIDEGVRPMPITVNVTKTDILAIDVAEFFSGMLKKYRIPPKYLDIDISRTAYLETHDVLSETVAQLQQMGFRVVLDGFDGNYMELSALGDIGTDVLKLDLCSAEMQNRTNALPGIFVQARTLRLNLLAEGIESAEQLNVLRKAGCTEGQGYFFSRPLSVDEFAKILKVGHAG